MDKNETKCCKMFQPLVIKRAGRQTKAPIREQPIVIKGTPESTLLIQQAYLQQLF